MIQLKDIQVLFRGENGPVVAVKNVSLSIGRGEVFGIVGASGAGKSTLLRTINLLERPTGGSVTVDGTDITAFTGSRLRAMRLHTGMIFQQFNLINIRKIIVAGEPGGSIMATRQAIESIWNAELYDFYGISDIFGACAGMCQERDGLHIAEDHLLVEVIDPVTGTAVPDGGKGEMVLTTLQKQARPMIRFRTGDIITRDTAPCACGRTHARIWIHGRTDDMFIVSGVNLFPSDIEFAVRNIDGITGEYRITLYREKHLTRFALEVERSQETGTSNHDIARQISHLLRYRYGIAPHTVTVLEEGGLPRAVHKAKRVIDKR